MEIIRNALELAILFLSEEEIEKNKTKILELAMELWEEVDPTPDIDLDDEIVEAVIGWLVDFLSSRN